MKLPAGMVLALALGSAAAGAPSLPTPNVSVELRELDPRSGVVPPYTPVYGRVRYHADAPVRVSLRPYRNGQPIERGVSYSRSPMYQPPAGEAIAWFAFDSPQSIDEIRAIVTDTSDTTLAHSTQRRSIVWSAGAAQPPVADWVTRLKAEHTALAKAQVRIVEDDLGTTLLVQFAFFSVPLSVILQIVALRKLTGGRRSLAGYSAIAMLALWLFGIVTAIAGSNISPIWIVFLSPAFVIFLAALLILHFVSRRRSPV